MNYLLFTYFDNTVENAEEKTQEIGTKLAEHMTSGQVKFMFGEKHAIFHFAYKGDFQDVSDILFFISEEVSGFEYVASRWSLIIGACVLFVCYFVGCLFAVPYGMLFGT